MSAQTLDFESHGLLHLKGAVPARIVNAARDLVFKKLERQKLRVNGKLDSSKIESLPLFRQTTKLAQLLGLGAEIEPLLSGEVTATIESLLKEVPKSPVPPQLLLSFPHKKVDWSFMRSSRNFLKPTWCLKKISFSREKCEGSKSSSLKWPGARAMCF